MQYREEYHKELQALRDSVMEIGRLVIHQVTQAFVALETNDSELASRVLLGDREVDALQYNIEDRCTRIIATEQPVAGDLREVVTTIKIVSNMERIGDHAKHLIKALDRVSRASLDQALPRLKDMANGGLSMLEDTLEAFESRDFQKVITIAQRDEEIDRMRHEYHDFLLSQMKRDPGVISDSATLMFLNRFMERLGDHVTNICEWVYFAKTGHHVDLND